MVIAEAARLIDDLGAEGLSLAVLAGSLGVKTPSLYKHVDGMPAIRHGIMLGAKKALGDVLGNAAIGRSRDEAVAAMSIAYRTWARKYPGQYPLAMHAPIPGDEEDVTVSSRIVEIVFHVLTGYNLEGDDVVDATRYLRAALHGFVALEELGGFGLPADPERSYLRLIDALLIAFDNWPRSQ